ncbi:MAG: hypothetical protein QXM68_04125 [Candidatus Aenigmatarchaeota archaeon]|nr:hypothetical protein [Candidatus Aenigmarchaeota archaeon]
MYNRNQIVPYNRNQIFPYIPNSNSIEQHIISFEGREIVICSNKPSVEIVRSNPALAKIVSFIKDGEPIPEYLIRYLYEKGPLIGVYADRETILSFHIFPHEEAQHLRELIIGLKESHYRKIEEKTFNCCLKTFEKLPRPRDPHEPTELDLKNEHYLPIITHPSEFDRTMKPPDPMWCWGVASGYEGFQEGVNSMYSALLKGVENLRPEKLLGAFKNFSHNYGQIVSKLLFPNETVEKIIMSYSQALTGVFGQIVEQLEKDLEAITQQAKLDAARRAENYIDEKYEERVQFIV